VRHPGHARTSLAELGDGVFRKVRPELGITAFGVNAMVLAPGTSWFRHTHDRQDELYFVHRGRAAFEVGGERFELEEGGFCHVEAQTPRWFANAGDTDLVLLVVGGHDGYVGRDGRMVDPADEERRRQVSEGGPLPS
jgi:quercetin dioxygenase-like cupin family protein